MIARVLVRAQRTKSESSSQASKVIVSFTGYKVSSDVAARPILPIGRKSFAVGAAAA